MSRFILFAFASMEAHAKLSALVFESLFYFLVCNEVQHCFGIPHTPSYVTIYFFKACNIYLQIISDYRKYLA